MGRHTFTKLLTGAVVLAGAGWAFDKYSREKFNRSALSFACNKYFELTLTKSAQAEMARLDELKGTERHDVGLHSLAFKAGIADVYDDGNDDSSTTYGLTTYRFEPTDYSNAIAHDTTILFLHGGAYVTGFSSPHTVFMARLAHQLGLTVLAPDYDPAPYGNAEKAFKQITGLYAKYRQLHPEQKVILIGDSAGGGMAFGLALSWAKQGLPAPEGIIAISPWVDATLTNPEINNYADRDPMLSADSLLVDAREWADNWAISDPRISPIKADVRALRSSNVVLLTGTDEIFYPDITAFAEKLVANGVNTTLHIGEHMTHDYPLQPIPEAAESWGQIEMGIIVSTVKSASAGAAASAGKA